MPNINTGDVLIPISKTPSSNYIGYWNCAQPTSDSNLQDQSGKGNHMSFGSALTGSLAFATAGRARTYTDGANLKHFVLPKSVLPSSSQSWMLSFRILGPAPAATDILAGCAFSSGSSHVGFYLRSFTTGRIDMRVITSSFVDTGISSPLDVVLDNSNENVVSITYDAPSTTVDIYINGEWIDVSNTIVQVELDHANTLDFFLGGRNTDGHEGTWRDIHWLKKEGSLPSNISNIIKMIYRHPYHRLSQTEWP